MITDLGSHWLPGYAAGMALFVIFSCGLLVTGCGEPDEQEPTHQQDQQQEEICDLAGENELVNCRDDNYEPVDEDECECARENIDMNTYPDRCQVERVCGQQVGIDCGAAIDDSYYYVDGITAEKIEYCGGYCQIAEPDPGYCENCPPVDWECETY